jgi:hypothetical protein
VIPAQAAAMISLAQPAATTSSLVTIRRLVRMDREPVLLSSFLLLLEEWCFWEQVIQNLFRFRHLQVHEEEKGISSRRRRLRKDLIPPLIFILCKTYQTVNIGRIFWVDHQRVLSKITTSPC